MGRKNKGYFGQTAKPNRWSVGETPKKCENCDFMKAEGFTFLVHPDVYSAIFALTEKVKVEWQMLLTGTVTGQTVYATGYYVPKQEVTGSTVKNLECIDKEFCEEHDVVIVIHSHSTMSVFFSQEDEEKTNHTPFINHFITVNNAHEFVAKSRYNLPCGMVRFVDAKVQTLIPTKETVEGMDKITEKKWAGTYTHYDYRQPIDYSGKGQLGWNNGKTFPVDDENWKPHYQWDHVLKRHVLVDETKKVDATKYVPSWINDELYVKNEQGVWVLKEGAADGNGATNPIEPSRELYHD